MAILTALVPGNQAAGEYPLQWDNATDGSLGDDSDSTFSGDGTNGDFDGVHSFLLGDVDTDLRAMTTLSVVLRYARSANGGNKTWDTLACRIVSADEGIILAAADAAGAFETVASDITTTTPTDSSSIPFSYVNTEAPLDTWDDAVIEIRLIFSRVKGGNTDEMRVYEADLTGTYDDAALGLFDTVQLDYAGEGGSSSWAFTLPATPVVGNTLIAFLNGREAELESNITTPDVDWVNIVNARYDPTDNNQRRELFVYIKPVEPGDGTGHTFDRVVSSSSTSGVLMEVKGLVELDQETDAGDTDVTSVSSGTTGTTDTDDELILACNVIRDSPGNTHPYTWTQSLQGHVGGAVNDLSTVVARKIVSATGTFETTIGISVAGDLGVALITLKEVAAGGQSIAVGVAAEVETAQPVPAIFDQSIAVGVVGEVEAAVAVAVLSPITVAVPPVAEVEAAIAVAVDATISVAVDPAAEVEAAVAVAVIAPQIIPVGVANEVEAAVAVAVLSPITIAVGPAAEVEAAVAVAIVTTVSIGVTPAAEVEAAVAIPPIAGNVNIAVTPAAEVEAAVAVSVIQGFTIAVGVATETETPESVGIGLSVEPAAEVEAAVAVAVFFDQSIAVGVANEVEVGRAVPADHDLSVTRGVESESAIAVAVIAGNVSIAVGPAAESEAANAVAADQSVQVAPVAESESAQVVSIGLSVSTAQEAESASSVGIGLGVESAAEVEAAVAVAVSQGAVIAVGVATEAEAADIVGIGLGVEPAAEVEAAVAVAVVQTTPQSIAVGVAVEVEAAVAIEADQSIAVGVAAEVEAAVAITLDLTTPVSQVAESETAQAVGIGLSAEPAAEVEAAVPVAVIQGAPPQSVAVVAAMETEQAEIVGIGLSVGVAPEVEAALAVVPVGLGADQSVAVGVAIEVEFAAVVAALIDLGFFWRPDGVGYVTDPVDYKVAEGVKHLALDGVFGSYADTPDINLNDADTAHVQQSIGRWTHNTGPALVLSTDVTPLFGDFTIKAVPTGFTNIFKTGSTALVNHPASEGDIIAFAADIQVADPLPGRELRTHLDFRDASNVNVGTTASTPYVVVADTWQRTNTVTATAPADTAYVRLFVTAFGGVMDGTETFYGDRFTLREGTDATWVPSLRMVGNLEMEADVQLGNYVDWQTILSTVGTASIWEGYTFYLFDELDPGFDGVRMGHGSGISYRDFRVDPSPALVGGTRYVLRAEVDTSGPIFTLNGAYELFVDEVTQGTVAINSGPAQWAEDAQLRVGAARYDDEFAAGKFRVVQVRDGIGGPVIARFDPEDFDDGDTDGATATDAVGRVWTLHGGATIVAVTYVTDPVDYTKNPVGYTRVKAPDPSPF
jgi:hypothetical protein